MGLLISAGTPVPISLADSTPSLGGRRIYYPQTTLGLANQHATYSAIYRGQVWVATLVNKLAYGAARLPLKIYERTDDGRTERRDSPFARLIRNPNSRHDPFFFWLWTASTFEVYGEAVWLKLRPGRGLPPKELWPLHPSNITVRRDDDTGELIYQYQAGPAGKTSVLEFPADDIVHFRSYNPDDQVRGMSRLEPLRQTLISEDAARRASTAFWQNGARPSVLLSKDGVMSQPAIDRLKTSWDALHGGVDSWGKTAVLEEGLTPHIVQLNAEEMQYVESKRLNREEACGIYDVPPPVVHILDRATFSNITEQMRSMYRDTMAPRLGLYESVIDSQLRPDFDPTGKLYAEFLMEEVMRGAFEARAVANQAAINSGQRTPNEVRTQDNLPPLPGGDQLFINSAAVPLVDAGQQPSTDVSMNSLVIDGEVVRCPCGVDGPLSARGLCRGCEGRLGAKQAWMKEHV